MKANAVVAEALRAEEASRYAHEQRQAQQRAADTDKALIAAQEKVERLQQLQKRQQTEFLAPSDNLEQAQLQASLPFSPLLSCCQRFLVVMLHLSQRIDLMRPRSLDKICWARALPRCPEACLAALRPRKSTDPPEP